MSAADLLLIATAIARLVRRASRGPLTDDERAELVTMSQRHARAKVSAWRDPRAAETAGQPPKEGDTTR